MTVQLVIECVKGMGEATASQGGCGQQGQAGCMVVKNVTLIRPAEARGALRLGSFIFLISKISTIMVANKVVRVK